MHTLRTDLNFRKILIPGIILTFLEIAKNITFLIGIGINYGDEHGCAQLTNLDLAFIIIYSIYTFLLLALMALLMGWFRHYIRRK